MPTLRRIASLVALVVLVGAALAAVGARPARACSCVAWTDTQAVDAADVVFTGTVRTASPRQRATGNRPDSRVYTVAVDDRLKGEVADLQRLRTPADSASCGIDLTPGARVLVFAAPKGSGLVESGRGEVTSTLCSGTRVLDGPVPDEVRTAAAGPVVDCAAAIDTVDAPDGLPPGYREIAGVVALPTDATLQLDASGPRPHFAKVGLAVRTGATATLTVAQDPRGRVAMEWGSAGPASVLRVEGCVAAGGAPWLVFAGGFLVDRPTCVRLTVTGTEAQRVRVPVGRACSRP